MGLKFPHATASNFMPSGNNLGGAPNNVDSFSEYNIKPNHLPNSSGGQGSLALNELTPL